MLSCSVLEKPAGLLCPWGFSRQEYWSGFPCLPPGDLPNPEIEPRFPTFQADSLPSEPPRKPKNTGVGSLSLLQGIFLTQKSNQGFLYYRQILYHLSYQGSPIFINQFRLVTQSCLTLCDPTDCSTPGFPVHRQLPQLAQTYVHWVGDAIQPSPPLSSPSPPAFNLFQHQGLFQWVTSLHQGAKLLELQHQSFQWIFRTDFL